ncbi:hypothetical protein ACIBSW_17825 [Actinoplanes sp. NPDC049668]|uniref:hypothetical protein n=1 Tax=unclassified Actinoplanes TaxID=2626549 RepID=UPI0033ABC47C
MSDDRIQQGLDAYADHLQRTAGLAPAGEVRRRAARRRRNRAAGAAFAAVLISAVGIGTALARDPGGPPTPAASGTPGPSASAMPTPSASASSAPPRSGTRSSNVSQLRELGVDLGTGVLIDVADDGVDRWMQVGAGDVVDFTGAAKDSSTEMSLVPAPVTARNRVVIAPPARPGSCVADTPEAPLVLQPCRDGDPAQTWRVVPAGDSGQFNLEGQYGVLTVDEVLIDAAQSGRTGLQTIPFDR